MSVTLTTYLIVSAGFVLLMVTEAISYAKKSRSLDDVLFGNGNFYVLTGKHVTAIIILGPVVLLYILLQGNESLWRLPAENSEWLVIWSCSLLAALLMGLWEANQKIFNSNKPASSFFPPYGLSTYYFLSRIPFLIIYEFFFRSFLLENIMHLANITWAVAFNLIFYSLAHIFSNRKEIIGTIPFGLLLCIITIKLQSVWPAVSIHLVLALSHEIKLIYHYSHSIKKLKI